MTEFARFTESVARRLWGEPNEKQSSDTELRWGTHGARSVNIDAGTWYDWETKTGGGCLDLIMRETKRNKSRAVTWLVEQGFMADNTVHDGSASHGAHEANKSTRPKEIARYTYTDELREPIMQVRRLEWPATNGSKPEKTFVQYRSDGRGGWLKGVKDHGIRLVPYRLADLLEAIREGRTIFIAEGEKKCDALWALDVPATCNAGGAKKWKSDWSAYFRGADVVLLPDNDQAGRHHIAIVGAALTSVAKRLRVLELPGLPDKGDVIDWLIAGGTSDQLYELVQRARMWVPSKPANGNGHDHSHVASWRDRLLHTSSGAIRQTHANVCLELEYQECWQDVTSFDEFGHKMWLEKPVPVAGGVTVDVGFVRREFTDADMQDAWLYFQRTDYPQLPMNTMELALPFITRKLRSSHPVRAYLESLKWDGRSRVRNWLFYHCAAEDTGDETHRSYVEAVGLKWLVSAVARIFEPGCKADHCLILEGEQGIGKTSAFAILGGEWFSDSLPGDLHSKDASQHLRGRWIIELAELSALSRSETETVKSFLSRQEERFRPPYGRTEIAYPRQCVFAGSTNQSVYLKDETGGRRFWPVKIAALDLEALRDDRDQLWAEAVYYYQHGCEWWFNPRVDADICLIEIAKQEQFARFEDDPWQESIISYCRQNRVVSIAEILEKGLGVEKPRQSRVEQMRVARVISGIGYEKLRRMNNVQMWGKKSIYADHADLNRPLL